MFRQNKRNGRVLLPLLSTLDKLLSHGYLDELISGKDGMFVSKLMSSLSSEANGCSDVKRLLAIVGVSLNLLQPNLETASMVRIGRLYPSFSVLMLINRLFSFPLSSTHSFHTIFSLLQMKEKILQFIMMMLLNRYPRVRRYTAEQLYVKLAEDGEHLFGNVECLEEATQLLLTVVWHEEHDPSGHISKSRNRIADLLGIDLSTEERNAKIRKLDSRSVPTDEFESYSSLINSTT